MRSLGLVLRWLGYAMLAIGAALILLGYAGTLLLAPSLGEGLGRLLSLLSPFNVGNWLAVILTLMPGLGLIALGRRISGS